MIQLSNVTKEYKIYKKDKGLKGAIKALFSNKVEKKIAVDNISLNISKGEIVGYIGSNGAGKSTTIKMMTGIIVPTSGTCLVRDHIAHKSRQENAKFIGTVFGQRSQLWWDLPLIESFLVLKDIYDIGDNEYKEQLEFLDNILDLNEFINRPVRMLSLGQRMRADLAAALLHNPQILFLDEPTIGLDVVVKEKIRKAIKLINKKYNTTVLLTTHDLNDIEELCTRIIIIDNGKIVYDGTVNDLKKRFGYTRMVDITIRNISEQEKKELEYMLNFCGKYIECKIRGNILSIKFNKNKVNVSRIISLISSIYEITDINIIDIDIETIIKMIYEKEVEL